MLSRISFIFCTALMLYASLMYYPRWKQEHTESAIGWDVAGYYWYLPSVFIYHDLKGQSFKDSILKKYQPTPDFQEGYLDSASGHWVMKYSSGTAFAMLPAFSLAHLAAKEKDGFSRPYQLAIQLEWLAFAIIGLALLRWFLQYYFTDGVVAITLLLLVAGSNYLNWSVIDVGQTHGVLFTLYAALLLQTRAFYLTPSRRRGFLIGLTIGFMVLIRPTEILSVLIPVLWGLERISMAELRRRFSFIAKYRTAYLLALVAGFIGVLPQLIYWKYATGRWFVYSYKEQGFSFLHPHFKDYTFDYSHGWLIFAPVMILAIIGIIPFLRNGSNRLAILAFALVNYYVVASWDVWSYGSRAMMQSYPILCVLLASCIAAMLKLRVGKPLIALLAGLFIYYNCWWTYFSHPGLLFPGGEIQRQSVLEGEEMSGRYFWRVAGRWHTPPDDVKKLNDVKRIFEGEMTSLIAIAQPSQILTVDAGHPYSEEIKLPYRDGGSEWVRVCGLIHPNGKEWNHWSMRQLLVRQYRASEKADEQTLRIDRFVDDDKAKSIYLDVHLTKPCPDTISVSLWNSGSPIPLEMDNIRIAGFRGK